MSKVAARFARRRAGRPGFTLTEVAVSVAIVAGLTAAVAVGVNAVSSEASGDGVRYASSKGSMDEVQQSVADQLGTSGATPLPAAFQFSAPRDFFGFSVRDFTITTPENPTSTTQPGEPGTPVEYSRIFDSAAGDRAFSGSNNVLLMRLASAASGRADADYQFRSVSSSSELMNEDYGVLFWYSNNMVFGYKQHGGVYALITIQILFDSDPFADENPGQPVYSSDWDSWVLDRQVAP